MTKSRLIKDPAFWLIVSASLLFIIHLNSKPLTLNILGTDLLYRYSVNMSFEAPDEDVVLRTFFPIIMRVKKLFQNPLIQPN